MLRLASRAQKVPVGARGFSHGIAPMLKERTVGLIGAPLWMGQPKAGVETGVQAIRDSGVVRDLQELSWNVNDYGDVKAEPLETESVPDDIARNSRNVGMFNEALAENVYRSCMAGELALTLGGDHSVAIGSLAGALRARPDTGVIWVDAHADLHTTCSSPSGNLHGQPLGFIMGLQDWSKVPGFDRWSPENRMFEWLKPKDLVYIGLRDIEKQERDRIRQMGIKAFCMKEVDKYGIGRIMEMTFDHLLEGQSPNRSIHLSYDVDAADPFYAPATGTTVRGGLSYRESHYIAESVSDIGRLGSMDLVEVNPKLISNPKETVEFGTSLIRSAFGETIL